MKIGYDEETTMKKFLILLFMLGIPFLGVWPQVHGKIAGIVTDTEGNPLEKVIISITSTKASTRRFEVSSDKDGKFSQVGLQPGFYQISFRKSGYLSSSKELRVSIASTTRLEVQMERAEEAQERILSKTDKLFLQGIKQYEEQKYEKAAEAYEEAIQLNPGQWGYYLNLGLTYKKLNSREKALAAFQKAAELNPESFSSNKELGEALAKEGRFEEAKAYYLKASELSPDDPDAFYNLGVCLTNLGEPENALAAFLKTTELKNDYADAYYQIGTLYIGQNKVKEAVESLEKFLELAPEHEKASVASQLLDYLKKD